MLLQATALPGGQGSVCARVVNTPQFRYVHSRLILVTETQTDLVCYLCTFTCNSRLLDTLG